MKNFLKFRYFSTFDLKGVLSRISLLIIIGAISFSSLSLVNKSIDPDFISLLVSIGTKQNHTKQLNIAKTMLHVTLPDASFGKEEAALPIISPPLVPQTPTVTPLSHVEYNKEAYPVTGNIEINNQAKKQVDINALLNKELNLSLTSEPSVLIVHTHTTESYTPSLTYNYTPTETDRTLDPKYNMISVGEVIYNALTEKGINVIHDKTINDYPSYSSSYSKSLKLVNSYMEKYPSIKFVIDVHRDAIASGKKGTVTDFDPSSAQVMLVIGTDASGLNHPHWENNLSFALKLQHKMNTLYPTLARSINLRKERFNQHTAPYAFILEVGTNGNTLDEAKTAAWYFSDTFLSLFKL